MDGYVTNHKKYKVLTPDGFQDFAGIALMGKDQGIHLEFEDNTWVKCTNDHKIFINNTRKLEAHKLKIGDTILTINGDKALISKKCLRIGKLYDLIEVNNGNRFYTNNALVSNCFIINDETLIPSIKLVDLAGIDPVQKIGQVRWYAKPRIGRIYTVALDPSLGTGGDPAAIQVFEANTTTQVAEWKHNKTDIPSQIRIMVDIITYINDIVNDQNSIYYSIENNNIGEAALLSLEEYGEHRIPGVMLSEPRRAGNVRRYRKGFGTTHKTKIEACAKLKMLIASDRMKVNSRSLISELKNFVALGQSFAAKPGETDDLVMATILTVRMFQILKNYHKELAPGIHDYADEGEQPMPFIAIF